MKSVDNPNVTIAVIAAIISGIVTILVNTVTKVLNRRVDTASAKANEGNAAESMANAAKTLIDPLNDEIKELREQLRLVKEDNQILHIEDAKRRVAVMQLQDEITNLKGELRKSDDALEYLVGKTKETHPNDVQVALQIRKGDLHL